MTVTCGKELRLIQAHEGFYIIQLKTKKEEYILENIRKYFPIMYKHQQSCIKYSRE